MADEGELVLTQAKGKDIKIVFDYPMNNPLEIPITALLSRKDLVRFIGAAYRMIYQKEEATSSLPTERMCDRSNGCFLVNRAPTNGIYGIYGHDLKDLALHTVTYDINAGKIYLGIDS